MIVLSVLCILLQCVVGLLVSTFQQRHCIALSDALEPSIHCSSVLVEADSDQHITVLGHPRTHARALIFL
jgi:hypothetical protein